MLDIFTILFSTLTLHLLCPLLLSPAAIEACLGHMLKRRAAGFLRSDKIAALFTKVGKVYDTASEVCRKVQDQLQQQADLTRSVTPAFVFTFLPTGFIQVSIHPFLIGVFSQRTIPDTTIRI